MVLTFTGLLAPEMSFLVQDKNGSSMVLTFTGQRVPKMSSLV